MLGTGFNRANFFKIVICIKLKNKQHHSKAMLDSFPMVLTIESLCHATEGFTLGVKGLNSFLLYLFLRNNS